MSWGRRCRCGKEAVYRRAYSGEALCGRCFTTSIRDRVRRAISKYRMLKYGERAAVAVSGGKDSLSLLHVLKEVCRGHGTEFYAVTVDEGIRGYRDEALDIAESFTARLHVPHFTLSFEELFGFTLDEALKMRREGERSSCSVCGVWRRRALDMAAKRLGADVIVTAHNLDDVLQTFFINLLNGDLERIRWLNPLLQPKKEFELRRVKPFMETYEADIAFYAYLHALPFQSVACPYRDEAMRSEVRGILNTLEKRHPGVKHSLLKTALGIARNLASDVDKGVTRCRVCGHPSSGEVYSVCTTLQLLTRSAAKGD